jgi:GDSL-like Lipase/Acylhydrolase family/N-terminus of Esterase_SGNH_hydro-type
VKKQHTSFGILVIILIILIHTTLNSNAQKSNPENKIKWINAKDLCIEGKGWTQTDQFYDRLPSNAKGVVRSAIWELSENSAGICVRFLTNATGLSARWTLRKRKIALTNMAASGVSGLDLYVRYKNKWEWLGAAHPDDTITNTKRLTTGLTPEMRECLVYLPLYNGVQDLEIGIPEGATCTLPPNRPIGMKPIVFYGTSIVQGGAASRPGMTYPALLCRHLDQTMINLGFSGNAICEPEVASLLAELDPSVYVLDPLPNMGTDMVTQSMPKLIQKIRDAHPKTPIVLIEHIELGDARVNPSRRPGYVASNKELRKIYEQRKKDGDRKIYYVRGEKLLGTDGQGTVDRVHPSDLGFMRMTAVIEPILKRALNASK